MTYSLKTVVHNVTRNKHLVMIGLLRNMTAQQRASKLRRPNNWSLVSTSCWYHYQIMCLPPSFRFQKIQDTINSTIDDRRILMQKTSHPATSVFFSLAQPPSSLILWVLAQCGGTIPSTSRERPETMATGQSCPVLHTAACALAETKDCYRLYYLPIFT